MAAFRITLAALALTIFAPMGFAAESLDRNEHPTSDAVEAWSFGPLEPASLREGEGDANADVHAPLDFNARGNMTGGMTANTANTIDTIDTIDKIGDPQAFLSLASSAGVEAGGIPNFSPSTTPVLATTPVPATTAVDTLQANSAMIGSDGTEALELPLPAASYFAALALVALATRRRAAGI